MMGKMQRAKGARGERAVADAFREALPWLADRIKRGWQAHKGTNAPDIDGVEGFWIESKAGRLPNPRAALQQAIAATDGRIPVAVVKDDRQEPFVVLRLRDFIPMVRDILLQWPAKGTP